LKFNSVCQGFKNFLRKLRGEQLTSPLTSLDDAPDVQETEFSPGRDAAEPEQLAVGNGAMKQKEGCGGPGGMCCCPCGALKNSTANESKKKMEKVFEASIYVTIKNIVLMWCCCS
jgi:hypothetical protein